MIIIVLYKAPIMLFKDWVRLAYDFMGKEVPFSKLCVLFTGLYILLWPVAVSVVAFAGTVSSFFLGFYAAAVAYLLPLRLMSIPMIFLYLQEGSCFLRLKCRICPDFFAFAFPAPSSSGQPDIVQSTQPPLKTPPSKMQELEDMGIFFKACEDTVIELNRVSAVRIPDLEGCNAQRIRWF